MNQDQLMGVLRIIVPTLISMGVTQGVVPAGAATNLATAATAIGAVLWSYFAHSDSAKIAAVTALPHITKVVVASDAPQDSAAAAAAADTSQPKVTTEKKLP